MRKLYTLILLTIAMLQQSCGQTNVESPVFKKTINGLLSGSVKTIDVEQLMPMVEKKEEVVLLDARAKTEYDISHIPGAIWVGYNEFDVKSLPNNLENKKVVVYCSVGYRSEKIGEKLESEGYANVLNLYGGIFEWSNQEGTLVNHNGETSKIHGYNSKWALFVQKGEVVID